MNQTKTSNDKKSSHCNADKSYPPANRLLGKKSAHKYRNNDSLTKVKLGLNERQIVAIEYTRKLGRITNREYVKINLVARPTATRELTDLVAKGILQQHGKGRGSGFTLAKIIMRQN